MDDISIARLKRMSESEDRVEFKEARKNFSFAGSKATDQAERRRCFLGYVVGFANDGGGMLVMGMTDKLPRKVVGTDFANGATGKLVDETYQRLGIRVQIEELTEAGARVLVIRIPSRPVGKLLKFEGVPLMRTGESLRNMSDEEVFAVLSEREPDFTELTVPGMRLSALDGKAVKRLKESYARKQGNMQFMTLADAQALSDLGLVRDGKVTYAALILLGKDEAILKHLPQAAVVLEYRNSTRQITFDQRIVFNSAYFNAIDAIWTAINQRNGLVPIQEGPFIFDIPFFNQEVIREAVNNAVAHRDYRRSSEVLIRQYPSALHVVSPGGFPFGVTLENLLVVNSTPRNRLLAEVLAKTGVVERSGQGIDKIYYNTLSEAKPEPDFQHSDNYQVELRLSAVVEDKAFALFIKEVQQARPDEEKLGIQEVLTLNRVRKGEDRRTMSAAILDNLVREGLLEKIGKGAAQRYILSKAYYVYTNTTAAYAKDKPLEANQVALLIGQYLKEFGKGKMGDFQALLAQHMTRDQVRYFILQLVERGILDKEGKLKGTTYRLGKKAEKSARLMDRAMELGIAEMRKLGELPPE